MTAKSLYLRAVTAALRAMPSARGRLTVLDAATGAGNTLAAIAPFLRPHHRLISVDLSARTQRIARQKVRAANPDAAISFVIDDMRALRKVQTASIDMVCSDGTLNCLGHDYLEALVAFRRVLKPGGRLFIRDVLSPETSPQSPRADFWRCVIAAGQFQPRYSYNMVPVGVVAHALSTVGFDLVRTVVVDPCRAVKARADAVPESFNATAMAQIAWLPSDLREPFVHRANRALKKMSQRGPIWASYFIRAIKR